MIIHNWLQCVRNFLHQPRSQRRSRRRWLGNGLTGRLQEVRLTAERLEERTLLSGTNLVRDINEQPIINDVAGTVDSGPIDLIEINGTLFFTADTPESGRELWKSDGTAAGTVRVADINVGSGGSSPRYLTNVGGTLFFRATDGIHGDELWKSDGTAAGTVTVKDIIPGQEGSNPTALINVASTLFFRTNFGINNELWKSDGTGAGTVLVKDINLGGNSSNPYPLASVGSTLFFSADDGINGRELWRTDGTIAGTVLVKDINAGAGDSVTFGSAVLGSTLFFTATDGVNGFELWKSDGTESGTVLVEDINAGDGSSFPAELTEVDGTLFFSADNGVLGTELWNTDGTAEGTVLVQDIDSASPGFFGSRPSELTNVGGILFFNADDGIHGIELWKSDGTSAGTVLVKDIFALFALGSGPSDLTNFGGTLFFRADDGGLGRELWKSDGTELGTVLVKDINASLTTPELFGSDPNFLTSVGGTLFFNAVDRIDGAELWKSDGTSSETVRVRNINVANDDSQQNFNSGSAANLGGTLLFSASDGIHLGDSLWKSDGTEAGTQLVREPADFPDEPSPSSVSNLTNAGGTIFFSAESAMFGVLLGVELWKSDGTPSGTQLVRNIFEEIESEGVIFGGSSSPRSLTDVAGTLFFSANDRIHGRELWKSNTSGDAVLVKDINTENGTDQSADSLPNYLTNVGGILFFTADDGVNGTELWKSDGTETGTVLVKDIFEGASASSPRELTNVNGTLFFVADDGINGAELWKSNGTTSGTVLVKEYRGEGLSSYLSELTAVGDTLFFSVNDSIAGYELWKSDGTESGTVLVKDINTGSYDGSYPSHLTTVGGTLFFVANDGINGAELWQSNGTAEGTTLVKNIRAGDNPSSISYLTNVGGTLFFRANDGISGDEVWRSNGTAAGTVVAANVASDGGSNPRNLIDVNGRLFFTATDNTNGNELRLTELPEEESIPSVSLSVSAETLAEAAGATTVTATLSSASSQDVSIVLGFSGTATNISDYARSNTQIVIAAGNTTGTITLTAVQDTRDEANETIVVDITGVTNGIESGLQQVAVAITDDDAPPTVSLGISPATLAEAAGTSTVTATLSASSSFDVTVALGFGGSATNVLDYTRSNTQIVIAAGSTTGSITLTAVQDTLGEENETVVVEILNVTNGTESGTQAVTGTIVSDDTEISVAVSPNNVVEDGVPNLVYTFTRSGITTGTTTVNLSLGGTATLTTDYAQTGATTFTATSKTLVFTAGQTTKTITINPVTDTTIEADETVILTVNPSASYSVGTSNSATGTITNDDFPRITLAASPASVLENGTGNIVYTFTRPGPTFAALTVDFTVGGTATFATDYAASGAASFSATTGSVTFGVGQATKTVTLDPTGDATVEPNETILLGLSAGSGYLVGTPTPVTTTITNDDAEVSVTVAPSSVTEDGTPNLVYTFTRVGATTALTVNFNVSGTATLTTDFAQTGAATVTASAGTLSFASGQSSKTITINPVADAILESDETVTLTLATATTYSIGTANAATGTILNDDPRVSLAVTTASLLENGTGNATYTFTRTGSTAGSLTVNFTVGGTATFDSDYLAIGATSFGETSGSVTFNAGQATKTVVIDPVGDNLLESNETVVLTVIAGDAYVIGPPTAATTTITNDDAEVTVAVSPSSVTEDGTPNLVYTFTRVGPTASALTVNYSVSGSATITSDYAQTGAATFTASAGTVSIAAGQTTKTITINPVADTLIESDETVILTLAAAANYSIGTANAATGTITNDDPRVSLAVTPASVTENGTGNATYTFTRTGSTAGSLTVNFAVGGTATFNSDYATTGAASFSETAGTVTFAAGQATKTVIIDPVGDTQFEANETVVVTLAAGVDYVIGSPLAAAATIANDDTEVSVSVAPSGVNENGTPNLIYTFSRVGPTTSALTVSFTVGGTATFSSDYSQSGAASFNATVGSVSFSAGQSSKTVTIDPTGDTTPESDETVILTVTPAANYSAGTANSALGTILNDDGLLSLLSLIGELP